MSGAPARRGRPQETEGTDDPGDIDESIRYLTDFNNAEVRTTTPAELYRAVLHEHPRRANPGSLWSAAKAVKAVTDITS
jgi:hypothetical protein